MTEFSALLTAIGRTPDEHLFISYTKPGHKMVNIPTTVARAPEIVASVAGAANVWYSVQPEDGVIRHPNCRATKETVTQVVTLYADLDFKGAGVTPIQASSIIRDLSARLGTSPVAVVRSGGGVQPYWAIEPVEPGLGQLLLDAWKQLVIGTARVYGGQVDQGVYNADRILRVPGPPNLKSEYKTEFPDGAPTGVGFPGGTRVSMSAGELFVAIQQATAELPADVRHVERERTEHDARPNVGSGEGTPLDDFNTNATWDEILEPEGWQHHSTLNDGTRFWTRPGKKNIDGHSASTNQHGAVGQEDRMFNWSSSADLDIETPMSKAYVYAKLHHRGNLSEAAAALGSKGYGAQRASEDWATPEKLAAVAARSRVSQLPEGATAEEIIAAAEADVVDLSAASIYDWEYPDGASRISDDPDGWKATDLSGVLDGTERPDPADICYRKDGKSMYYRGKINVLIGQSETGKSWVAVLACYQVIKNGGIAIYIDFEDDHVSVTNRLRSLGASEDQIRARFVYIDPPGPLAGRPQMQANLEAYLNLGPEIVIVDAWNEAMTRFDMDWMEHKANNVFATSFLRQLAKSGGAVLVLDHVPKDTQSTSKGAIGPQVKRAVVNGCSIRAVATASPLTPGRRGTIKLMVDKDRPGDVRKASQLGGGEAYFGTFVLDGSNPVEDAPMDCHIFPPGLGTTPTNSLGASETDRRIMADVMRELARGGNELTQTYLEKNVTGTTSKVREILRHMEDIGVLELEVKTSGRKERMYRRKTRDMMSMTEQQVLDAILGVEPTTAPEES